MGIYDYAAAFDAADITSREMRQAREQWRALYFGQAGEDEDPCQRIAYTVVSKLTAAAFGEYKATGSQPATKQLLQALEAVRPWAFGQTLVEGECYLKPCPGGDSFTFQVVPRTNLLVFGRDSRGMPTDVGMVERSVEGNQYYTLLERRRLDREGRLQVENRLFRSGDSSRLGQQVNLHSLLAYSLLPEQYTYETPIVGLGMVRLKTPMVNCVDGSQEGVSVYGAATELIRNINRNELQMDREFSRGESRIIASKDMLGPEGLTDHLFVGLDEDPQTVGLTVFAPPLREGSYLARKLEYLRNVESIVGLRRGMLADANIEERTATEIASSVADFNLTVLSLQRMWQQAVEEAVTVCAALAKAHGLPVAQEKPAVDWGNGVLFDEAAAWNEYLLMVEKGLLKPEIALGWRFGMKTETPEDLNAIRQKLMP